MSRNTNSGCKSKAKTYESQNSLCFYCGKATLFAKWTIDHKDPRSRGGTNEPSNKVGSCSSCNKAKDNMTLAEFLNTSYLDEQRRLYFGCTSSPMITIKQAKKQHILRLGKMIERRLTLLNRIVLTAKRLLRATRMERTPALQFLAHVGPYARAGVPPAQINSLPPQ